MDNINFDLVMEILKVGSTPAGVAIMLSIGLTQVIKTIAHRKKWRPLKHFEQWSIAWVATAALFPLLCLAMGVEVGKHFGLGLLAGFISPVIVRLAKRVGIDIDRIVGIDDRNQHPPRY